MNANVVCTDGNWVEGLGIKDISHHESPSTSLVLLLKFGRKLFKSRSTVSPVTLRVHFHCVTVSLRIATRNLRAVTAFSRVCFYTTQGGAEFQYALVRCCSLSVYFVLFFCVQPLCTLTYHWRKGISN